MNYVVRILDPDGRLKKERIMFNAVRILDSKGNLKKVIRNNILSQKYWERFSDCLKTKQRKKNLMSLKKEKRSRFKREGI